ncbi:MAG: hypothetical protein N2558_05335, partial [Patescibacteria group bacterium]|nr:hypothetical protein [Patescibacteria group bacterium]
MLDIVSRLVFFVACSHQKQLQRLIKKHPELLKKDSIFVHDTIITKEINTDTIFYPKHFTDTFYLDREKLKIQIIRQRDTIRVHAKVQPDTVFVEKKIPIDRIQVKYDYFNPLLNKLLIFSFLLLLFLILLHDKRKNKWADPLTQAMILLILGLILFFIFKKMTAAFSMFALSAIRGFYMLKHEKGLI